MDKGLGETWFVVLADSNGDEGNAMLASSSVSRPQRMKCRHFEHASANLSVRPRRPASRCSPQLHAYVSREAIDLSLDQLHAIAALSFRNIQSAISQA